MPEAQSEPQSSESSLALEVAQSAPLVEPAGSDAEPTARLKFVFVEVNGAGVAEALRSLASYLGERGT